MCRQYLTVVLICISLMINDVEYLLMTISCLDCLFHWDPLIIPNFCFSMLLFSHPAAAAAKSLQLCPTLCDPTEGLLPSSSVPGILQARTVEWVAISFSNAWKWKVKGKSLSHAWLLATPWTAAYQAPLSTGFSRQEYWSGVPLGNQYTLVWHWPHQSQYLDAKNRLLD